VADSLTRLYLRALTPKRALRGVPAPGDWSAPSVACAEVPVDPEHLRRYRQLCGFPDSQWLPPTYPHLTAFPMGMELLTRRDFPYPLLGLVHLRNEITQLRPIGQTESLDYHVWVDQPYEHEKGTAFDVRAEVADHVGNLVWRSSSTYLRRSASRKRGSSADAAPAPSAAPSPTPPPTSEPSPTWQLPPDLGRRYAALSGDRNPIHLYPWTARLFGFRRQIAHGMWTAARCLAALGTSAGTDTPTGTVTTFSVDFRAPVLLPSAVTLETATGAYGATEFTLVSAGSGRAHLTGRLLQAP
jgi:acyl dehydratase